MAKAKGAVTINVEQCKGCNLCATACPMGVLALAKEVNSKGYNYSHMANPDACTGCANCGLVCPDGVIEVYRIQSNP